MGAPPKKRFERSCATPSGQDRPDRFGLGRRSRPGSAAKESSKTSPSCVATRRRGRTSRNHDPARYQRAVRTHAIRARDRRGRLARRPAVGIHLDDVGHCVRDPNWLGAPSVVASTSASRSCLRAGPQRGSRPTSPCLRRRRRRGGRCSCRSKAAGRQAGRDSGRSDRRNCTCTESNCRHPQYPSLQRSRCAPCRPLESRRRTEAAVTLEATGSTALSTWLSRSRSSAGSNSDNATPPESLGQRLTGLQLDALTGRLVNEMSTESWSGFGLSNCVFATIVMWPQVVTCGHKCYSDAMSGSISVRDLRNTVSEVLRRVEGGERLTVTVDRRPVAEIVPLRRRRTVSAAEALGVASRHVADRGLLRDVRGVLADTTDDL